MEKVLQEKNSPKNIVKIVLKTLLDCFIALMLVICFIFALFPKLSLKINETLGLKSAMEFNYQTIYDRSGKIDDLYNLIIFEQELKHVNKELVCLNEILAHDDYKNFCKAMDEASVKRLNNKRLTPYSANINGFLVGRKVQCLYSLASKNVQSFVYEQTKNGKFKEYSFAVYVDLVCSDENLNQNEKKIILEEFIELQELDTEKMDLVSLEELVENKIDGLKSLVQITSSQTDQIIYKYELMRFYGANASLYEILGDSDKQTDNFKYYEKLKAEIG